MVFGDKLKGMAKIFALNIMKSKPNIHLLLDNIRSVYNVGSIFRTAETLGISKKRDLKQIFQQKFGRKRKDFAKVALGAEDMVAWESIGSPIPLVKKLQKENFTVIALEQTKNSVDYKKVKAKNKTLVILGNEVAGVSKELLELANVIAEIPMKGKKESLNVSVAAGVFLFRLLD